MYKQSRIQTCISQVVISLRASFTVLKRALAGSVPGGGRVGHGPASPFRSGRLRACWPLTGIIAVSSFSSRSCSSSRPFLLLAPCAPRCRLGFVFCSFFFFYFFVGLGFGGGGMRVRGSPDNWVGGTRQKSKEGRVSRDVIVPATRGPTAAGICPSRPPMHCRRPLPRCRTGRCRRKRPQPSGALSSRHATICRARA